MIARRRVLPLDPLLPFSGCPGLTISTSLNFTPSNRTTGFRIRQHGTYSACDRLVRVWKYIRTCVRAFDWLRRRNPHAPPQTEHCGARKISCSHFAGDGGSNSWCYGFRVNTRLRVCKSITEFGRGWVRDIYNAPRLLVVLSDDCLQQIQRTRFRRDNRALLNTT